MDAYQIGDPNHDYKMEYKYLTPLFRERESYIHDKYENKNNVSDEWVIGDLNNII